MMKKVRPKKNLGQHFLTDLNVAKAIADTVDACPDLPVLEVGPGMGVLTQYLIEKPRELRVVEIDRESVAYLHERFPQLTEKVIEGDFLRMDLSQLFNGGQFVLTGNYPYDISTQIFFKMLDNKELIPCCTGMIQREVAQRMASTPGTKAYGILSVLTQAWTDLGCDEKLFKRVVKTVFNQRRKMLRVSLKQIVPADVLANVTDGNDILTRRPEQLSIPEFVELTNKVQAWMQVE